MSNPLQLSLIGEAPMTLEQALEVTAESLQLYAASHKHWAIAYSGGKDSSATVTAVVWLIQSGRVPKPKTLTVIMSDTRMELTPLFIGAEAILRHLSTMGIQTRIVVPKMDDRFFVYMFGRGVPPPSNTFRWCTAQLKIEPMELALSELRQSAGEKLLMITGVRLGESAARDSRITTSCSRDGAECGQGWFQVSTPTAIADTLAPLLHWRVCHVWDWLMFHVPDRLSIDTTMLADVYGQDEENSAAEIAARTGCVGCNLASDDHTLRRLIRRQDWQYLSPLLELRALYAEMKLPANRLRKNGELRADGSPVSNQGRLGPLTFSARIRGLKAVLGIQRRINEVALINERPAISLINNEELRRICQLIRLHIYPERWTGQESTGDTLLPWVYTKGNGRQGTLLPMFDSQLSADWKMA
jgi:DNA sulfur modification protein DndC